MTMKRTLSFTFVVIAMFILSACTKVISPTNTAPNDVLSPTEQIPESTPVQTNTTEPMESFSSDKLGICFSYPQGYSQIPYGDTVEIVGPGLPGSELRAIFWLEKSEAFDRTTEVIADQELTIAGITNAGRWSITLDGEPAVVLDGMPGQDLQRRVYVVHQQSLYVLAFMPTLSGNKAVNDQMEALFSAITDSWSWSPCSSGG
jgi:hypothetical protein